jgi:hypothetical protein
MFKSVFMRTNHRFLYSNTRIYEHSKKLKYSFYPLLQAWNTSSVPISINIIKENLHKDGWKCESKKFVGFYGVTKEDSIQYLKNSYPGLRELPSLIKNIENHHSLERFSSVYINRMDNPSFIHLWEYYPGAVFSHDELNGYVLHIISSPIHKE